MPTSDDSLLPGGERLTRLERDLVRYVRNARSGDDSRQIQLLGTGAVQELERKLCRLFAKRYALAVSSGTAGLMMVGLALGLRRQEFIAPALAHGAALGAWAVLGNRPRFADVDPVTLTLDPDAVARRSTARTAAILAVDLLGTPADTAALRAVADRLGVPLVLDAAQSLGATRDGVPTGTGADVLVTSFTSGKTLFAGEGGAIMTDNRDLYERLVAMGQHPYRQRAVIGLGDWNDLALNARIHPLGAIWANRGFEQSLRALSARRRRVLRLLDHLYDLPGIKRPPRQSSVESAFFRVSVGVRASRDRERLLKELATTGRWTVDRPLALADSTSARSCPEAVRQVDRRVVLRWR